MIRLSTGLRDAVAGSYGLGWMMNGGIIRIFTETQPDSPDMPPTGTQIARITTGGRVFHPGTDPHEAGLMLAVVSPGTLVNDGSWVLRGIASGTAGWWRWCWADPDDLSQSDILPRIDGAIGESLILGDPEITIETAKNIESFFFTLPMS